MEWMKRKEVTIPGYYWVESRPRYVYPDNFYPVYIDEGNTSCGCKCIEEELVFGPIPTPTELEVGEG